MKPITPREKLLAHAGYMFRVKHNDWIRDIGSGRFHAKPKASNTNRFSIHFDIFTYGKRHFAPPMPMLCQEELDRLSALDIKLNEMEISKGIVLETNVLAG